MTTTAPRPTRSRPAAPSTPGSTKTAGSKTAATKAYDRRDRRLQRLAAMDTGTDPVLLRVGRPLRERLARVPFVIAVIALLAFATASVLYLNTRSDQTGIQISNSQERSGELRTDIEALEREVAQLDSLARIAAEATKLGMAPTDDVTVIDASGPKPKVIELTTPGQEPGQ
ncbi:hypothetical protein [Nakamurella aerolata]|uniref:Cell division protein FtsL n=1 Tax=Nakamurella aerolata TaxID=1656892 RepID=A0A849A7Q4_9ACTN|nr:hypothetical protein [Nakamurella aerolata]NNG36057.1 hypothetical protein [Nakamurella aerolata]